MLVRAGAVIPLLPPDVDTLSGYGRRPGLVHLSDRRGQLRLLAFPRGQSSAVAGTGQLLRSVEAGRRWTLLVHSSKVTHYRLQASLRTLEHPFKPCAVRLGRRVLRAWSYNKSTGVLRVRFATRSGRLTVSGHC